MKVGVVGYGVVGAAVGESLKELGHEVSPHDITMNTQLSDVLGSALCFLCVPTPKSEKGECDTTIVEEVIANLDHEDYPGIICIKSTVEPGTTRRLAEKYPQRSICFVPEFLRERCAKEDFQDNHDLCVIGCESELEFQLIKKAHGRYPKSFIKVPPTEAELCKYFNNIYNATLVVFANSFYEVCKNLDADYSAVKNAMVARDHIGDFYLNCKEDLRGFGGMCLPKDTSAMAKLCENKGINVDFFKHLLSENDKYEVTVFDGMRKE
jgi:UDPglucose 6-dehydrogenase